MADVLGFRSIEPGIVYAEQVDEGRGQMVKYLFYRSLVDRLLYRLANNDSMSPNGYTLEPSTPMEEGDYTLRASRATDGNLFDVYRDQKEALKNDPNYYNHVVSQEGLLSSERDRITAVLAEVLNFKLKPGMLYVERATQGDMQAILRLFYLSWDGEYFSIARQDSSAEPAGYALECSTPMDQEKIGSISKATDADLLTVYKGQYTRPSKHTDYYTHLVCLKDKKGLNPKEAERAIKAMYPLTDDPELF